MVLDGTQSQNMRPNKLSHIYIEVKSSMNIGKRNYCFSENLFLVMFVIVSWFVIMVMLLASRIK